MFYLVIGILFVVVGAIVKQRSRRGVKSQEDQNSETKVGEIGESHTGESDQKTELSDPQVSLYSAESTQAPASLETGIEEAQGTQQEPKEEKKSEEPSPESSSFGVEEEIEPLNPLLAAAPISSPNAVTSATYSSVAPPALGESPYAYSSTEETKSKSTTTLLRWSGKMGTIQVGDLTISGPVTYWSEGLSSTTEPSCIDITLPVEYPGAETELPQEGASSYREMTPLQRGVYLLWLAGGRIQPPSHVCYPMLWLFGLERRVLADRLDISVCIGEAFRLLPLMWWESLRQGLIKFIAWMAAKAWLPEEQLMAFGRSLPTVPTEILNMLLRPYADAKLPLPSSVAFTVMRTSPLADKNGINRGVPHTDELIAQFAAKYKLRCSGGIVLSRPKHSIFVAYVPTNPTLVNDKNAGGGVLELPDFFKDMTDFAPLMAAWRDFLKNIAPPEPVNAAEELDDRPDWDPFIRRLLALPDAKEPSEKVEVSSPLITRLDTVADLVRIERPPESEQGQGQKGKKKPAAADRKKIVDAARVEGFLILPDLGIAGKEYQWDDTIALAPFPAGTYPSQDYNAAALLLEYVCALKKLFGTEGMEKLKSLAQRLDDYFTLTAEDHVRLDVLSSIFSTASSSRNPNNIGECLQFWLQREQRVIIRDFLISFSESGVQESDSGLIFTICNSLDVERLPSTGIGPGSGDGARDEAAEPIPQEARLKMGLQVSKILAPLFKD